MAFFDELSKKLSGVSRVAVRKAKEVTDIGSLKLQIADENRKLSKIYENLGREYYDKFQDDAAEELAELVSQIKDSNDHQFHFPIPKAPQNGHENPFCGVFYVGGRDEKVLLTRENGIM